MKSQERVVFFNGEFVKESEAKISIYDSALMFGDMASYSLLIYVIAVEVACYKK